MAHQILSSLAITVIASSVLGRALKDIPSTPVHDESGESSLSEYVYRQSSIFCCYFSDSCRLIHYCMHHTNYIVHLSHDTDVAKHGEGAPCRGFL